ncbi:hypothetical protein ACO0K3_04790 [Undibacterium sp. Rencai35W]|uniref:hypothetical protein n=1 Tax=Undibacterium sp. Rencai35W TaxID=3413046 RepID=UPI003BF080B6
MTDFAKYDNTGRILATGSMPAAMLALQDGNIYAGTVDADRHYIADGVALPRPVNPATFAGATLSNLPAPCVIRINASEYPCTDSTATLNLTLAGTYAVTVIAFPFLDAIFTITK